MTTMKQSNASDLLLGALASKAQGSTSSGGGDYFPQAAIGSAIQYLLEIQDEQNKMSKMLADAQIKLEEFYGSDKGIIKMMQTAFQNEANDTFDQYHAQWAKTTAQAVLSGASFLGSAGHEIYTSKKTASIGLEKEPTQTQLNELNGKIEAQAASRPKPLNDPDPVGAKPAQEEVNKQIADWKKGKDYVGDYNKDNPVHKAAVEQLKTAGNEEDLKIVKKNLEKKLKDYDKQIDSANSNHQNRAQQISALERVGTSGADAATQIQIGSAASQAKKDEGVTSIARMNQQAQMDVIKSLDNNSQDAHRNANSVNDVLVAIGRNSASAA